LKRALLILILFVALPYARSPIYRFPPPAVFTGNQLYNPYAGLRGEWRRANFHAHGQAWIGLTSGAQTDEEVVAAYRHAGYDVPGLSNYHRISMPSSASAIPIYEHGYNLGKRHQLAIGARRVEWFDFPFVQFTSQRQLILDLLTNSADLVAIAHPSIRTAYTPEDLTYLTGYQLIEVVNGPFADDAPWDTALSSGHAVWGLADDDTHDVDDPRRFAIGWNMVNAASASRGDIVEALRGGHFYAVNRLDDNPTAALTTVTSVEVTDDTLTITCAGATPEFEFFGQDGYIRQTTRHTLTASYTFDPTDTYIRAIIWAPRYAIYLNPILRWDGAHLPMPVAAINQPATWLLRLTVLGVAAAAALLWRGPAAASAAMPAKHL
jgi:hypothetical protein